MKKINILILIMLLSFPIVAQSQDIRIAIFDPVSSGISISNSTKIAIRELISSAIVNTGKYSIIERSMLEKVMEEQSFSNSGVVDDTQATEIGKLAGANKIILSVLTQIGDKNMLSVKMIDVETAQVERQKVKVVPTKELLEKVEPLTLSLIDVAEEDVTTFASGNLEKEGELTQDVSNDIVPASDEVVFYFPGVNPSFKHKKKEKEQELNEFFKNSPIYLTFDGMQIGSGTVGDGFMIRVKNTNPGIYEFEAKGPRFGWFVKKIKIKVDTERANYFEIKLDGNLNKFSGVYKFVLKESKLIK